MAQAPKCKVCGSNHYGGRHVWPADKLKAATPGEIVRVPVDTIRTRPTPIPAPDDRDAQIATLKTRVAELEAKLSPPKTADRAAYMREWRAKRRSMANV